MASPDRDITTAPGWDAALYQGRHSFVWKHAAKLLDVLAPRPGERVLDLGCGTGQLAGRITAAGAHVVGIDNSPQMVGQARRNFPLLRFEAADATAFDAAALGGPFDAVFSNAVLHWVKPPQAAIERVWQALRPGGRFVAEFGGERNVKLIRAALRDSMEQLLPGAYDALDPWYFPSAEEYSALLERQGFRVSRAMVFDRPTPLEAGEQGMANWLHMFGASILAPLTPEEWERLIDATCSRLRPALFDEREGRWSADYRRLWVEAYRPAEAHHRAGEAPAEPRAAGRPESTQPRAP